MNLLCSLSSYSARKGRHICLSPMHDTEWYMHFGFQQKPSAFLHSGCRRPDICRSKCRSSASSHLAPEERHGPPADCGGIPGFHNLLKAISDPGHEQHEELLEWLGDSFDPQAFSVDEVNGGCSPCSASQRSCRLQEVSSRMLFREMGQPNPLRRFTESSHRNERLYLRSTVARGCTAERICQPSGG